MTPTFDALGVTADLVAGLAAAGINAPMPIQALTIADALAGRDVCGKAGTGSGKTLAFGLPLLQRTGRARPGHPTSLVLVPTRELAVQVGDVLARLAGPRGRRVTVVYGGVPIDRQARVLRRGADVVVATPGRLIDLIKRRHVSLSDVRITVLDEADRMADMGFLPQVERLLAATHRDRQTMLFSATLDGDVDHLVRRHMDAPVRHEVASPRVTIESMTHHFLSVAESDRASVVSSMAAGVDRTLVFVRTKHGADRLANRLRQHGVEAGVLHGGISQAARQRALDRFAAGTFPVLVATDVAARGLDVAGLDLVVHYDPPQDHKSYLHRSGRTARAGAAGVVVTLVLDHQRRDVQRMQRQLNLDHPIVPAHRFNAKQLAAAG